MKYALRLRSHGPRTLNGDGGVSRVKCPDGLTFTFSACSLSINGTNHMRGQIPQILYYTSVAFIYSFVLFPCSSIDTCSKIEFTIESLLSLVYSCGGTCKTIVSLSQSCDVGDCHCRAPQDGESHLQNNRAVAEYQARKNAINIASAIFRAATDLLHRAHSSPGGWAESFVVT